MNEDLDLRVALPAVAAWLVAGQGRLLPPGVLALGACCVALFAALVLLRSRGPRAAVVAAVCVCAAAAGLATAARGHARRTGPLAQAARSSSSVTVEGVLTDDPRAVPPKADVLTFRQLVVAHVRVERLLVAGRDVHLREPVLILSSDEHWLGLLPSQHLSTEGRVQSPGVGDDVAALVSTRGPPRVLGAPTGLQRLAGRLRAGLRAAAGPLPGDERGLLPGLVEGDTSRLDPGLNDDFRATGLTHIVAVPGDTVAVKDYCGPHEGGNLHASQSGQSRRFSVGAGTGARVLGVGRARRVGGARCLERQRRQRLEIREEAPTGLAGAHGSTGSQRGRRAGRMGTVPCHP